MLLDISCRLCSAMGKREKNKAALRKKSYLATIDAGR